MKPTPNYPIPAPESPRAIRKRLGLSTQQLADEIGVSRRTVEGWEFGRLPSKLALRALADVAMQEGVK